VKTGRSVAVGFRVEPELIHWAAVDGAVGSPTLVAVDEIRAPHHYTEAQALSHYRDRVLHVLSHYAPTIVAVRYPEPYPPRSATESTRRRSRIEGVILEAASGRSIEVITGTLVTIAKNLGTGSAKQAKQYLEREDLRGLDWAKYQPYTREAILAAASALGVS
jgi:Holliday junction resolvasome RuvABC endonuclease subunit